MLVRLVFLIIICSLAAADDVKTVKSSLFSEGVYGDVKTVKSSLFSEGVYGSELGPEAGSHLRVVYSRLKEKQLRRFDEERWLWRLVTTKRTARPTIRFCDVKTTPCAARTLALPLSACVS
jgi:hypothetical protein